MEKLLFIDDDLDFLESNRIYFTRKGYKVYQCSSPKEAWELLQNTAFDCVILDIDMPEIDGFSLCRHFREQSRAPVIFLSGFSDTESRIQSFQSGGDDFLAKPYDILELEYRIRARIRRSESVFYNDVLSFGPLVIDMDRRIVSYNGKEEYFSALQFDILSFLAQNPGKVFSYEQLYDRIWKTPIVGSRHNLQVTVSTIRHKLTALCNEKQYIKTVSRKGYCFSPPKDQDFSPSFPSEQENQKDSSHHTN